MTKRLSGVTVRGPWPSGTASGSELWGSRDERDLAARSFGQERRDIGLEYPCQSLGYLLQLPAAGVTLAAALTSYLENPDQIEHQATDSLLSLSANSADHARNILASVAGWSVDRGPDRQATFPAGRQEPQHVSS